MHVNDIYSQFPCSQLQSTPSWLPHTQITSTDTWNPHLEALRTLAPDLLQPTVRQRSLRSETRIKDARCLPSTVILPFYLIPHATKTTVQFVLRLIAQGSVRCHNSTIYWLTTLLGNPDSRDFCREFRWQQNYIGGKLNSLAFRFSPCIITVNHFY
jgi:hypothetical protein